MFVLTGIIFLLSFLFYYFYLKPMSIRKQYLKNLRALNYRVFELPFKPFGAPVYEVMQRYEKEKKDALYGNKYVYQGYDVVLTNILNYPQLLFLNPKLARQVVSVEKVNNCLKVSSPLQLLIYSMGQGLVFLEGDRWKNRRKILSNAFNFEFLQQLVPLMS